MSYMLFTDESCHDRRNTPYEVRGGVALSIAKLWPFIQSLKTLEQETFGAALSDFGTEFKGHKLLDKDRIKWAAKEEPLRPEVRRKQCLSFLNKGLRKESPKRLEFAAYGQACLQAVRGIFELLDMHGAKIFASAIPRSARAPGHYRLAEYLRKDQVYLLERYFYFLEAENAHGLLVMDECEKTEDRRYISGLQRYFTLTNNGRYRTTRVVPVPIMVSSDMHYPVQVADVCIYCINWGFRLPYRGMNAPVRKEISDEFGPWINRLQYRGKGSASDGHEFDTWGIVYVEEPYG